MHPRLLFLLLLTATRDNLSAATSLHSCLLPSTKNPANDFKPKIDHFSPSYESTGSPFYDPLPLYLYFTDVYNGLLLRCDLLFAQIQSVSFPEAAVVIPRRNNPQFLVVAAGRKVYGVEWKPGSHKIGSKTEELDLPIGTQSTGNSTFLMGAADVHGDLWIGTTMGYPADVNASHHTGAVLQLSRNETVTPRFTSITTPGGMGWNRENTRFYYIYPVRKILIEYHYNTSTRTFTNTKGYAAAIKNITGYPVGLAIDVEGNLWISTCGSGLIVHYNPFTDRILHTIKLNAMYITGLTFGGNSYDTLYATTSRVGQFVGQPYDDRNGAGNVYTIKNLGTRGFQAHYTNF